MILTKTLKIKVNKRNKTYYENLGYDVNKKEIIINPNDLTKGSNKEIVVKCELCDELKVLRYNKWFENSKKGYYSCKSCKINPEWTNNKKQKSTKLKRYGDQNYNNIEKIKSSRKSYYSFEKTIERIKNKNLDKYNKPFPFFFDVDLLDIKNKNYIINCKKGHKYSIEISDYYKRKLASEEICTICNPYFKEKDSLKEIKDYVSSLYKGEVIYKPNILDPFEVDIFIPEKKLIIDYIDIFDKCEVYKTRDYFINKKNKIKESDYLYYKIYSDTYQQKPDIIKSDIMKLLGRSEVVNFDRSQEICDLDVVKNFLKENSIYGWKKYKIKWGLFQNENLISLLCLDQKNSNYIIKEFCELKCHQIKDAKELLIKEFSKVYKQPIEIDNIEEYKIVNGIRRKTFNKEDIQEEYDDKPKSELLLERGIFKIW